MESIKISVTNNSTQVTSRPSRLTSGTVGLPVEFTFDSYWDGLSKMAVFRAGDVTIATELEGTNTVVPWEVMQKPDLRLSIGVFGVNDDGTMAIPTVWANIAVIRDGANPGADPNMEPTLPVWKKLLNAVDELAKAVGELLGLKTNAKGNLVDAINEVHDDAARNSTRIGEVDADKASKEEVGVLELKSGSPYSLLVNGDFRNPVNQRNITSLNYPNNLGNRYNGGWVIDRWHLPGCFLNFDVSPYGVTIESSEYLSTVDFSQKIEYKKGYGKFTFAVCTASGEIIVASGGFSKDKTTLSSQLYDWGNLYVTYNHNAQTITASVCVANYQTITLRWAALYEGEYTAETLPKYQPKGYGVELAECLRYFYRFPNKNNQNIMPYGIGIANTAKRVGLPFRFPIPMRIAAPTVTAFGSFRLTTNWSNPFFVVTSIGVSERSTDMVTLLVDVASGLTSGEEYLLQGTTNASYIDFSADL